MSDSKIAIRHRDIATEFSVAIDLYHGMVNR